MQIKEVCSLYGLTKKAVEYYEKQGLIHPAIEKNGYRNYSPENINALKEISVLRKLNFSVAEIKNIMANENKADILIHYRYKMEIERQKSDVRLNCLAQLIERYDIDHAFDQLENSIDNRFTIREKLLQAFPDSYGMYLSIHFGRFLSGTIDSEEKAAACSEILQYLDDIENFEIPVELETYLSQAFSQLYASDMELIDTVAANAIDDIGDYIENNKESIEEYLHYRNSEEYKTTPAFRFQQLFLQFQKTSGYYDIFIKNLKILSPAYREYLDKLKAADSFFTEKYPQARDFYQ